MATQQDSSDPRADTSFTKARDRFLECLAKSDRDQYATCSSPNALIDEVRKFANFKDKCPRSARAVKCITTFCNRLEPYFETIGIFIQSHPEFAALAWGALTSDGQLASNFDGFFQKLTSMLSEIGDKLPLYQEILRVSPADVSESFRDSLVRLYADVFDFFTAVARVFTQKPGAPRRTPAVILDLMWTPFDRRFEDFKSGLQAHCRILEAEQGLIQLQMTADIRNSQVDEQRTAFKAQEMTLKSLQTLNETGYHLKQEVREARHLSDTNRVMYWLNPVAPDLVHRNFWKASEAKQGNTAEWILIDPLFTSWKSKDCCVSDDEADGRCLWIEGNPGVGKTVLAASVLESLQKVCTGSAGDLAEMITYFFFSHASPESTSRLNAYREILSQIFHGYKHDTAIFDAFVLARMSSSSSIASTNELLELLSMLVSRHVKNLKLLLDGVDESDDPDRVVRDITTALKGTSARILLFSRPNVKALRGYTGTGQFASLSLIRRNVEGDIRQYLSDKLANLADRGLLAQPPTEDLTNHLLDCANGMFLWARLMMDYVESPALGSAECRMEALWGATEHEDLERMYLRILTLISKRIKPERVLAQRILTWLTFQHRSLNRSELWEVLYKVREPYVPSGRGTTELLSLRDASNFDDAVIILCCSLVERIGDGYRLIHYTATEFLRDPQAWGSDSTPSQQLVRPAQSHAALAEQCLTYLVSRVPSGPLSGDKRWGVPVETCRSMIPFSSYAALYWVKHTRLALLSQRSSLEATMTFMSNFLSKKPGISAWVELLYTFASREQILSIITELRELADLLRPEASSLCKLPDLGVRAAALARDMASLNNHWGDTLIRQPYYIWNDVTAFEQSTSFAPNSSVFLHSFAPKGSIRAHLSAKPLFSISRVNAFDETLGVLSVWPPRSFDKGWRHWLASGGSGEIDDTTHWEARLEIWSVGSNQKTLDDIRFQVDPRDVREHYKGSGQLLQSGFADEMAMSFPAAISGRLDYVVILNSLYFINRGAGDASKVQRTYLPAFENPAVCNSTLQSMTYSYSYEISENGLYLGLGASKSWMSRSSFHTTSSLFMFRIIRSCNACEFITTTSVGTSDFKFHPQLPIVIIRSIASSNTAQLTLWLFDPETHHSLTLPNDAKDFPNQQDFLEPIHPISRYFDGSFEFSACGRNVIVRPKSYLSMVVSVESSHLYQKAACHRQDQNGLEAHASIGKPIPSSPQDTSTASSAISALSSTAVLTKSASHYSQDLVVASAEGRYEVTLEHRGKSKSVQVAMAGPNHMAKTHLLSVPDTWADIGNGVKPCIITQDNSECSPNFSVLLTQEPKHFYNPSGPRDFHVPALIQKDMTALLPSTHTVYNAKNPSRKRLAVADDNYDGSDSNKVRRLHQKALPVSYGWYIYTMDERDEGQPP
ncbi:hypothetical protein EDB81DRAFT_934139 [Dactylonectria macrodidyma]|uniref:NACHT domain-containing protein n=1 Tax=Dactylonectria macrodidyma TaxID=307937 RepID=A0A9P9J6D1_9HYPO|nr:hypothetical protein EDB81DRAFT_934139 [Dactylonectria macrodidyma]